LVLDSKMYAEEIFQILDNLYKSPLRITKK